VLGIAVSEMPAWLQAVAALIGVAITALGAFGVIQMQAGGPSEQASAAGGTSGTVVVSLDTVTVAEAEVRGRGSFTFIDPASQAIVFIGKPADDPAADWVPVVATLEAVTTEPDGRQSGRWEAIRPAGTGGIAYTWFAVVAPLAGGAANPYEDLRADGPESGSVSASSQAARTDE
jgi:hypothetical protein